MLRVFYLLIGLFFFTNIFAQYEDAYKIPYPRRLKVLDSLIEVKIIGLSNTAIIDQVNLFEQIAKHNNDERAIVFSKIVRFSEERKQKKITSDEANATFTNIVNECDELAYAPLKALAYLSLGNYYYSNQEQKSTSYYYYLKSYKIYSTLSNEEFGWKSLSAQILSDCFYKLNDYKRAIQFGISAIDYGLYDYYKIGVIDIIGMSYLKLNKLDSAIIFFTEGVNLSVELNKQNIHLGWQGIFEGNLGYCYKKKGEISTAINLLQRAIDTTIKYKILDNTCGFATALAEIYLQSNNLAYEKYVPIAIQNTYTYGSNNDKYNLYSMLKKYYRQKGAFEQASMYADSVLMYKDTLAALNGNLSVIKADFEIESEFRTAQERLLQKEIKQQNSIKYSLIALIVLVAVIFILLLNRTKLQHEVVQKSIETKQLISQNELAIAQEHLNGLTNMIVEKNHLIEQLELQNKNIQNIETVIELQNLTILTDEQWNEFKITFEKVHQGFLNNLKNKIANLSPAETRLLALAKLKLTTKEMAGCLGVTTQAVRTAWYRLRTKLNLSNDTSLEEFIETI
jgi:DNA-binding CsgD family transcriptional regulator